MSTEEQDQVYANLCLEKRSSDRNLVALDGRIREMAGIYSSIVTTLTGHISPQIILADIPSMSFEMAVGRYPEKSELERIQAEHQIESSRNRDLAARIARF